MPLRYRYFIYILSIHGFIAWLLFGFFEENKWYFLLSELGILVSILLGIYFFRKFNQPLQLMKYGVDAIKDEDYNVRFLETGSRDINELIEVFNTFLDKLGQERVSAQEQGYFLESIIKASPIGMIMLDYDDLITSYNEAATTIFGKKTLQIEDVFFQVDHPLIAHIVEMNPGDSVIISISATQRFKCQMNTIIHLGFKRKFIMIEEMSKELLENEKAAYGKVIRMMAHEVNNSMGAVNSILQSVIEFGFNDEDDEYREFLEVAKKRNEELAGFMKNFAEVIRLPIPNKEKVNLSEMAKRAQMIMAPIAHNSNVKLQLINSEQEVIALCDPSQIQQVVINAIKNAVESIGENGEVKISVNMSKPQLVISDNGPGIDDKVKDQLFTPFFSTKPDGQGIGLIISREILLNHGARFSLYTNKKTGWTHFEIEF